MQSALAIRHQALKTRESFARSNGAQIKSDLLPGNTNGNEGKNHQETQLQHYRNTVADSR